MLGIAGIPGFGFQLILQVYCVCWWNMCAFPGFDGVSDVYQYFPASERHSTRHLEFAELCVCVCVRAKTVLQHAAPVRN